jgi:hypothetical protein
METHPMTYEIWLEAWTTGPECQHGDEEYLGRHEGADFNDACLNALLARGYDMRLYNRDANTWWGCRFFDNQKDAK